MERNRLRTRVGLGVLAPIVVGIVMGAVAFGFVAAASGTNPLGGEFAEASGTSANDAEILLRVAVEGGYVHMGVVGGPGFGDFVIEFSTDLSSWERWKPAFDEADPPPPPPIQFVESLAAAAATHDWSVMPSLKIWDRRCFYRVVVDSTPGIPGR